MVAKQHRKDDLCMDEMVKETQVWLNKTYGKVSGFGKVPEDGNTGWNTVYGLTRALQHELGITDLVDNFGPSTAAKWDTQFANKVKTGFKHNRSEEHTSELQSRFDLVCRLLLEKKTKQHCA